MGPSALCSEVHLTVEEVRHVFAAAVCDPIYDGPSDRQVTDAIEKRMDRMFYAINKHGTQARTWTNVNGIKLHAELTNVRDGVVHLLRHDRTVQEVGIERFSLENRKYVMGKSTTMSSSVWLIGSVLLRATMLTMKRWDQLRALLAMRVLRRGLVRGCSMP